MALSNKDDVRDLLRLFSPRGPVEAAAERRVPRRKAWPRTSSRSFRTSSSWTNAGQNLATFCQTWEEPEVHKIMDSRSTRTWSTRTRIPRRRTRGALRPHARRPLEQPPRRQYPRHVGGRLERSLHARRPGAEMALAREAEGPGQAGRQANIVCGPVQIRWHKFARYWDVEIREVPMDRGRLFITPEDISNASTRTRSASFQPSA